LQEKKKSFKKNENIILQRLIECKQNKICIINFKKLQKNIKLPKSQKKKDQQKKIQNTKATSQNKNKRITKTNSILK
jgi:hypothetical protein